MVGFEFFATRKSFALALYLFAVRVSKLVSMMKEVR